MTNSLAQGAHDDDGVTPHDPSANPWFSFLSNPHYRLAVLISATILIAVVFSALGLLLYNISGTAQLDLSRPGFEGVNEIIEQNASSYQEFSSSGAIDQKALDEFDRLYQIQLDAMSNAAAFEGDPLSPDSLGIQSPSN